MPAYVIAVIEVFDAEVFAEYRKHVLSTVERYGGRLIARGRRVEVLEDDFHVNQVETASSGTPERQARVLIGEFPDMAQARQWWDSPEYAGPKQIRQRSSRSTLIFVEGA